MANTNLPSPDPDVTALLTKAYGLEGTAANQCYDAGATNPKLLAESERNTIKAEALYQEALQRIRLITGRTPVTTTTAGNTGQLGHRGASSDERAGDTPGADRPDAEPTTSSTATAAGSCGRSPPAST